MMVIEQGPDTKDKIFYWILGIIFVSSLISVPFMITDKNRALEKAWQENGCQMYDNYKIDNVPAKCNQYFTDHYKSQEQRLQPPDTN